MVENYSELFKSGNFIPLKVVWNMPLPIEDILNLYAKRSIYKNLLNLFKHLESIKDRVFPDGLILTQESLFSMGYIAKDFDIMVFTISKGVSDTFLCFKEYEDTDTWMAFWKGLLNRRQFFDSVYSYRTTSKIKKLYSPSHMYHLIIPTIKEGVEAKVTRLDFDTLLISYTKDYAEPMTQIMRVMENGTFTYLNHTFTYDNNALIPLSLTIESDPHIYKGYSFHTMSNPEVKEQEKQELKSAFTFRKNDKEYWINFDRALLGVDAICQQRKAYELRWEKLQPTKIIYSDTLPHSDITYFVFHTGYIWIPELFRLVSISESLGVTISTVLFSLSSKEKGIFISSTENKYLEIIKREEMRTFFSYMINPAR